MPNGCTHCPLNISPATKLLGYLWHYPTFILRWTGFLGRFCSRMQLFQNIGCAPFFLYKKNFEGNFPQRPLAVTSMSCSQCNRPARNFPKLIDLHIKIWWRKIKTGNSSFFIAPETKFCLNVIGQFHRTGDSLHFTTRLFLSDAWGLSCCPKTSATPTKANHYTAVMHSSAAIISYSGFQHSCMSRWGILTWNLLF